MRVRYIELLSSHLKQHPEALHPIPGAHGFIEHLENHDQYQFAVAMAGWRVSAEIKLTAAGFDFDEWKLYSYSDYEYKKETMDAPHTNARKKKSADFEAVIYIGDSRSDMRFSNELGYDFIGRGDEYAQSNI